VTEVCHLNQSARNVSFWGECAPVDWGNVEVKQFDESVTQIQPIDEQIGVRCQAIQAGMALGKTMTLEEILARPECGDKYPRIVMPTTRRVFSCSAMERFQKHGFVHYLYGEDINEQPDYGFVHVVAEIVKDRVLDRDAKLGKLRDVLKLISDTLLEVKNNGKETSVQHTEEFEAYLRSSSLERLVDADQDYQQQTLAEFEASTALENLTKNVDGLFDKLNALSLKQQRIFESNRIIIQYESLHRLRNKPKFDLVILDEVRSLATNMCCINQHSRLALNSEFLKLMMAQSKLTPCLDANLGWDGVVPHLLTSVFQPSEIVVHRYQHVAMRRKLHATA